MAFNDVIDKIGMTIDAAGVVVIVAGAVMAFVITAVRLSRRERNVYGRFRQQLGQAILLGLELLQHHHVHDVGYFAPGTFEQFPILDAD